jgi:hypothetical protein
MSSAESTLRAARDAFADDLDTGAATAAAIAAVTLRHVPPAGEATESGGAGRPEDAAPASAKDGSPV